MSESLRNDGRIWVPKKKGDKRPPEPNSRRRARLLPRAQVSELSATSSRATWPRATPKRFATRAAASAKPASAFISISADAIARLGVETIRERYGNLFDMYQRITDEDPYKVPMRIYPAIHYTMGGLWVDYQLHEHDPRPVRPRRSEFLRPRRQSPRRQRPDAGPVRRLFHHSLHGRQLSRIDKLSKVTASHPDAQAALASDAARRCQSCWRSKASAPSTPSTASSARSCGKTAACRVQPPA